MAAAAGDEGAWRTLVLRYERLVRSEVHRVQRLSREDYEDAVATTWLRLVDRIAHMENAEAVAGWLRTTAYREALRIARARARVGAAEVGLSSDSLGEEPDLTRNVMLDQIRQAITSAMDDLSPTGRRLLTALLADPDLSYRELEKDHGIGIGSIGPIRARVFRRVRTSLGEIGVTDSRVEAWGA
jgi:RNA polymerase sigma factor (sigma-70 family)